MAKNGITMMAHSLLCGGKLIEHKLLTAYCKTKGLSVANLALIWAQQYDCLPIMKISSIEHLYDAIQPIDIESHARILSAFENANTV
jgi:diketogulonate reductase-like aldo/keto reductase